MTTYIRDFTTLGKNDTAVAGGKGANLGELTRAGLPVPPGFVITAEAFLTSMSQVRDDLAAELVIALDRGTSPQRLEECAERMRELVRKAGVSDDVRHAVLEAYRELGQDESVAVRSSATSEAAARHLKGILRYTTDPIVSRDIIGDPASCVFDASLTKAQGHVVKVMGWYDNEWGYGNRTLDLTDRIARTMP